ncbi:enoyl-CoA hydratase/isomerase family protein [Noviherbaspirillum sp. Root189]|uniref:enoyl-CoA hydratase/isomerase family protein n=1 Tax=Noviherbaspirillum sp. Root189 TaxID=1736487 RepID=UPI001F219D6C|nr:enoyl-CoA hydratase/isomerase family protein [Noviherbaspirillum sp. Root189]
MDTSEVLLHKDGGIATITLSRPDKLNALSTSMRNSLGECLANVAEDQEVKVVVLRGEGRAFCAGADLVDAPKTPLAWRDRILTAQSHHMTIAMMRKPVIAAVQGAAVGGGASLALAADIRIMADDAKLVFPFVRLGIVPDGGASFLLQAKLHAGIALDLLLTGGTLTAAEAERLGLTRRVVSAEQLDQTSQTLARDLLNLPWEALMLTKALCAQQWAQGLQRALSHEADAFALATTTEGHKAALAEILKKFK